MLYYPPPPLQGAHCFSVLQIRHFWKPPTSSSHRNFFLGHLPTTGLRSGGSKNALLTPPPPSHGPTVSVCCK